MSSLRLEAALIILLSIAVLLIQAPRAVAGEAPTHLTRIRTEAEFDSLSQPPAAPSEIARLTKYLVPVNGDDPVPALFHNVNLFEFHHEFLVEVFADIFRGLGFQEYINLIQNEETRRFFAGTLMKIETTGRTLWGFNIIAEPERPPGREHVRTVQAALDSIFEPGLVHYAPLSTDARREAESWGADPGFPVFLGDSDVEYEAYTRNTGYGRVRRWTLEEFRTANESGQIAWQDILVLDRAPTDIEGVVSGIVTAERQGPLSHLVLRAARRGTPNAFIASAFEDFARYDGELVRLEIGQVDYEVSPATMAEAEAWWTENRPSLSHAPIVDRDYDRLDRLPEMDLDGEIPPVARYGGKAANLARFGRILDGELESYRPTGFAIPMHYYFEFMESNHIEVDGVRRTYLEHLEVLRKSPEFQSDAAVRFRLLEEFRDEVRDNGLVSIFLVLDVLARIEETFGDTTTMVRFRSSSNVEDLLEFNGAGLYDSTSVCAADNRDGDADGPSLCDEEQSEERTVADALLRVWASLWTFRAREERSWYQIPEDDVAMGVLVSRAFLREQVNGVAFTGNPTSSRDPRYQVTAQLGEVSVVHPDPGVLAEKNLLFVDRETGDVIDINRFQPSSIAPPGTDVLSDDQLRELARVLAKIDRDLPVRLEGHRRDEVRFDIEFKIDEAGRLAIKQVRPFLLSGPPIDGPVFVVDVPADTLLCGVFVEGRSPELELDVKSQMRLRTGRLELPTDVELFFTDLIEEIVIGAERLPAEPRGPGFFTVSTRPLGDGDARHTFSFRQEFSLPDGELFVVELDRLRLQSSDGEPSPPVLVLDDSRITQSFILQGIPESDIRRKVVYSSCEYSTLPRWDIRADLEDGTRVHLSERFRPAAAGTAPAGLVAASITFGDSPDAEVRATESYWHLVYTALHHNFHVRYWILLDPPVEIPGVGAARILDLEEPQIDSERNAQAAYLDAELQVIGRPAVTTWWKGPADEEPPGFKRGDTNGDDDVNLSDVIFLLNALFRGAEPLACQDAGDFDDDGAFEINDGILILFFLFDGVDLSEPPGPYDCGQDPTRDLLEDCTVPCP